MSKESRPMNISDKELAQIERLLHDMEKGLNRPRYKLYVGNRIRNIRLMLTRAKRREKHTLL